eukprot:3411271-Rhodomonas_salina.1
MGLRAVLLVWFRGRLVEVSSSGCMIVGWVAVIIMRALRVIIMIMVDGYHHYPVTIIQSSS